MKMITLATVLAATSPVQSCFAPSAPVQKVVVKGDTYCRIAKKITWSKRDTPPTVSQVRRHNATRDRVCGQG